MLSTAKKIKTLDVSWNGRYAERRLKNQTKQLSFASRHSVRELSIIHI